MKTTTKRIADLVTGDVIVFEVGSVTVVSNRPAVSRGYFVVRGADGRNHGGHGDNIVRVAIGIDGGAAPRWEHAPTAAVAFDLTDGRQVFGSVHRVHAGWVAHTINGVALYTGDTAERDARTSVERFAAKVSGTR